MSEFAPHRLQATEVWGSRQRWKHLPETLCALPGSELGSEAIRPWNADAFNKAIVCIDRELIVMPINYSRCHAVNSSCSRWLVKMNRGRNADSAAEQQLLLLRMERRMCVMLVCRFRVLRDQSLTTAGVEPKAFVTSRVHGAATLVLEQRARASPWRFGNLQRRVERE